MENLSKEDLDDVLYVFKMLDVSSNGRIMTNEAYVGFLSLECRMTDPAITQLIQTSRDKGVNFDEFLSAAVKTMPSTWSHQILRKCFKAIDLSNSGTIGVQEVQKCIEDLGLSQHINPNMISDMIARGSNRRDMNEQEFVDLFDI